MKNVITFFAKILSHWIWILYLHTYPGKVPWQKLSQFSRKNLHGKFSLENLSNFSSVPPCLMWFFIENWYILTYWMSHIEMFSLYEGPHLLKLGLFYIIQRMTGKDFFEAVYVSQFNSFFAFFHYLLWSKAHISNAFLCELNRLFRPFEQLLYVPRQPLWPTILSNKYKPR